MTWLPLLLAVGLLQHSSAVRGDVVDGTGLALPGVVVTVKNTTLLAVTDERGHFDIATAAAEAVLVFAMQGFETKELALKASSPREGLKVRLELASISSKVVVHAPAGAAPPDERVTLRPLDVVRTAGAQADVMRALAVLPGVTHVDEGAGLFVRGGDVSETLVLLDEVPMAHPYRYETPTGGFRGAVDPFLTQGMSFATGGFSAEFGNSLSGIVDMRGVGRPAVQRGTVTAGLAGVSAMFAEPLGSHAAIRVAANRTTPSLLFAVNPSPTEFDRLPGGWDLSVSGHVDTATHGTLRVFMLDQRDHVGVKLEQEAFSGFLHSGAEHRLFTAVFTQPLARGWTVSFAGGADVYTNTTDVGVFAVATDDRGQSVRVDIGGPAAGWQMRIGADAGRQRTDALGQAPTRGGDFAGVDGESGFNISRTDWHGGTYAEASKPLGRLTPTLGVRSDYFDAARATRVDPRVNLLYDLGAPGKLRFAWGLYHQAPSPEYFDNVNGATTLAPMTAAHYVAGYELGTITGAAFFRAEAYVKTYRNLPVQDAALGFADTGYGHARGVDLFTRRVWHFMDIRAGLSLVDTARRWTAPDQRDRYPLPAGTWKPDFDVPYTWNVVINAPVSRTVAVGAAWRTAAGRPMTPAIGAIATPSGYEPIWGPINSERLPRYERLDLSVSMTRNFGKRTMAVFFASLDNALGRLNFFEYAYSADYSTRHPVLGASPRSFYVGCSVTR